MGLLRRKNGRPKAPPGYRAVHHDDLDAWLELLGEQVAGAMEHKPPEYLRLAFMAHSLDLHDPKNPRVLNFMLTAGLLGYLGRAVEFDVLGLDEYNETIEDFLRWKHDEAGDEDDWFASMNYVASMLVSAAHSDRPVAAETTEAVRDMLAPEGMGADARRRYALLLLSMILDSPDDDPPEELTLDMLISVWRTGYYIRACDMSMPPEGMDELLAIHGEAFSLRPERPV